MTTLTAIKLPESDALKIVQKARESRTFVTHGIEARVEVYEPAPGQNWLAIVVRAETEAQANIGKGYLLALADG